jgi:NTP pyrophosphatase (non-canonical NTP hydrolase)
MSIDKFDLVVASTAGEHLVELCHGASERAGWWRDLRTGQDYKAEVRSGSYFGGALVAQKLCLIHSEISEAMEGHRKGLMDDKLPHRPMVEVELADAIIRCCDLAGALGLDLGGAIAEKLQFNAQRQDHKPEARAAEGGKAY